MKESMKIEDMTPGQLVRHMADPDVQDLLRQELMQFEPYTEKRAWARLELQAILKRAGELTGPSLQDAAIAGEELQAEDRHGRPGCGACDGEGEVMEHVKVEGFDSMQQTGRMIPCPYCQSPATVDDDDPAKCKCAGILAHLPGCPLEGTLVKQIPTLGNAAEAVAGEDANMEIVPNVAPGFQLTDRAELPEGTPHSQRLAFSIERCACARCMDLRKRATRHEDLNGVPKKHEPGCQCAMCTRTRMVLAELAERRRSEHADSISHRWPDAEDCSCQESDYPVRNVGCPVHGTGESFVCTCNPARELARVGHEADCAMARTAVPPP